ncbi:hypothetical protein Tco_0078974 [Tanacetum coccineum]
MISQVLAGLEAQEPKKQLPSDRSCKAIRRRGRPKLSRNDRVKYDMKELLLSEDMTSIRNERRARIKLGG